MSGSLGLHELSVRIEVEGSVVVLFLVSWIVLLDQRERRGIKGIGIISFCSLVDEILSIRLPSILAPFKVISKGLCMTWLVFLKQTKNIGTLPLLQQANNPTQMHVCLWGARCFHFLPSLLPFFGKERSLTQNSSFLYPIVFLVTETCMLFLSLE